MYYLVARGLRGQPTLQHKTTYPFGYMTLCGIDVSYWSRGYLVGAIPQIFCLKCMKKEAKEAEEHR